MANPPVSVAAACAGPAVSARRCERASLAAIDDARASEGLEPMELPPGYQHLGVAEQLVVVTNLERTARDLPALDGPQAALDELASAGLSSGADPEGPPGTAWASNAAAGIDDALQADYEWMYDDGPGGTNVDCTSTSQSGCWEHRANILSPWPGAIGAAGEATAGQRLVLAEVMVARN